MAEAALAAQAAGGAMQTVGSYYAAAGQKMQLKLQARLAEINAEMANSQARDALMQGQRAEQAVRMQGAQVKSAQRAAMGASGVDLSSETSVALQTSTEFLSELDANTVKANALRAAWGHRMNAVNYRGQAIMGRAQAKAISPAMAAFSTLLTQGAQFGQSYAGYKNAGMLGSTKAAPGPASSTPVNFQGMGMQFSGPGGTFSGFAPLPKIGGNP